MTTTLPAEVTSAVPPRRRLARYLAGQGVELGPGHSPFALIFPGATVRFVDRWRPTESRSLFPELGATAPFPEPDVIANFDVDRLGPLDDASQDFVIASHVLEHLAEPLGFLGEIHRVLRPGGMALILLPERSRTFDRDRQPTPLSHLIDEHRQGVTGVTDEHLREFLETTSPHEVPAAEDGWPAVLDRHRLRSIHVHCWTEDEFPAVIDHAIRHLGQRWELVDAVFVADGGVDGMEFGYALKRTNAVISADALADRFHAVLADIQAPAAASLAAAPACGGFPPFANTPSDSPPSDGSELRVGAVARVARTAGAVVQGAGRTLRNRRATPLHRQQN